MRLLLSVLLLQLIYSTGFGQSTSYHRQLKMITLSGDGYQRGLQHGQQLKKEIAAVIGLWKKDIEESTNMPADSFIAQFLSATNFTPLIKKYAPDVLEEVKGIADGSGQRFNDVFASQLGDELWVYEDRYKRDSTHYHCSGIGVPATKGKPAYVSQNLDIEAYNDNYQVLIHILPNKATPEQFILTCPGQIALNGMNEYGIGVCVNTLMQLKASSDGLPVAFMIRTLLAQKDGAKALYLLQHVKHASGQNYILGTVDSVYDFEASASKVVRMYPDASGIVYHTNHPIVNDDIKPWYKDYYQKFLEGTTQNRNSEIRFASLKKRANETGPKDDLFIKTTLRSKDDSNNPVCRTHLSTMHGFTFGSVILTLSDKRLMEVTAGPPDESEYQTFSFKQKMAKR